MKASWKPQVKKPSTKSTKERWPKASESAVVNDCCCAAGTSVVAAGGVASASDNGTSRSISAANTISAVCQPKLPINATPNGANRNWPNDPAAVPAPSANPRHSSGNSLANADSTRLNEQPDSPKPTSTPALRSSDNGVAA